jgi:hypothetical protein
LDLAGSAEKHPATSSISPSRRAAMRWTEPMKAPRPPPDHAHAKLAIEFHSSVRGVGGSLVAPHPFGRRSQRRRCLAAWRRTLCRRRR